MRPEFWQQVLEKYSAIKFNENPFIGSEVVPCGQTDGGTAMTKLMVTFRNFANGRKKLKVPCLPLILNFERVLLF